MKAVRLNRPDDLASCVVPDPEPAEGDVLIRVRAATICGTDVRIFRGKKTAGIRYPSVLGHEFAGEVIDTGGHASLTIGDRVGLCPFMPCMQCRLCKSGRENLCTNGLAVGYEIDGAFAEIIRIPGRAVAGGNLRKLPESMGYAEAALVEPLACVMNGQNKVGLVSGDTVVVLGAGPIGLMHIKLARLRGASRIISAEPSEHRRKAARDAGADAAFDPTRDDLREAVLGETQGFGADVVICAVGIPSLARQATDLVAFGGRVSLFAGFTKGETAEMDVNAIHYREITVTGAFGLSRRDYDEAFELIARGRLSLDDMITHQFSLNEAAEAFALAESGDAIKVAFVT